MHHRASAVIFDLDGVLVTTDELHYAAWKSIADELGIPFSRHTNHQLRGVSRMASLEVVLSASSRSFTQSEKEQLAHRKNTRFVESLQTLDAQAILPGVLALLDQLCAMNVPCAVASSSRNARLILDRVGLRSRMHTVVDGNDITRSKPDPQVFLLAAHQLALAPAQCVVVEDAESGVDAANAANMPVLGVGDPQRLAHASLVVPSLAHIQASQLLALSRPPINRHE